MRDSLSLPNSRDSGVKTDKYILWQKCHPRAPALTLKTRIDARMKKKNRRQLDMLISQKLVPIYVLTPGLRHGEAERTERQRSR